MKTATALTRLLLLLYPPSFRREMGEALVRDVRRTAMKRSSFWLIRLAASLIVNAAGAWAETLANLRSAGSSTGSLRDLRPRRATWLSRART